MHLDVSKHQLTCSNATLDKAMAQYGAWANAGRLVGCKLDCPVTDGLMTDQHWLSEPLLVLAAKGQSTKTGVRVQFLWPSGRGWTRSQAHVRRNRTLTRVLERYARAVFYVRKANGQALTLAAQRQRLSPLRGFFGWLTRERLIAANPAADLILPKSQRRLPRRLLSVAEFEDLVRQTHVKGTIGIRDRAILETLFATAGTKGSGLAL